MSKVIHVQLYCPWCWSGSIYRHGLRGVEQTYLCRGCGKTFLWPPKDHKLKEIGEENVSCPRCGGRKFYRNGPQYGPNGLRCKECGKFFQEGYQNKISDENKIKGLLRAGLMNKIIAEVMQVSPSTVSRIKNEMKAELGSND